MDLASAGLAEQPFRTHGKPLITVPYASHREALKVMDAVCKSPNGLALLQGPALSGKSTAVRQFVDSIDTEFPIAVVDGDGVNTTQLLEGILRQFGYELDYNSANELFGMLRVFARQQAAHHDAPLVIVENAHALRASAMRALGELARLSVRHKSAVRTSALKFVLVSDLSLRGIASEEVLEPLLSRATADMHLRPMSVRETTFYLHQKLKAGGSSVPEFVFPATVCNALHEASGGWPGILDRLALLALAKAPSLPVAIDRIERPILPNGTWNEEISPVDELADGSPLQPPQLVVSEAGNSIETMTFDRPRMLIGRSQHNDLTIDSKVVSRHHILLVRHGGSTFLMDLNSTNGTRVNSHRVSNHVLMNEDVITIGSHTIKFYDANATTRGELDGQEFADTIVTQSLDDLRKQLAEENTQVLPTISEDSLPNISV